MNNINDSILIEGVSKDYPMSRRLRDFFFFKNLRSVEALKEVNLEISRGEIFGLLGPNGSGKTTLQKILCGLLTPTSGLVSIFGGTVKEYLSEQNRAVSYVFEGDRSFYWRLTGRQNLEFFAALSGCDTHSVKQQIPVWAKQLHLCDHLDKKFAAFSAGNRQKLSLVRSLLTNPQVLVMDEPTRSLDPEVALQVYELVTKLVQREGKTVIWASHNLAEVEEICSRVAVINRGQVVAVGEAKDIRSRYFELVSDSTVSSVIGDQASRQVACSE